MLCKFELYFEISKSWSYLNKIVHPVHIVYTLISSLSVVQLYSPIVSLGKVHFLTVLLLPAALSVQVSFGEEVEDFRVQLFASVELSLESPLPNTMKYSIVEAAFIFP